MEVRDSRRLTGPNILWNRPGAVLDVALDLGTHAGPIVAGWEDAARPMLVAVGWGKEKLTSRTFRGGVSLALSAPVDALYAATEVNEWAWEAASQKLTGGGEPEESFEAAAERLRSAISEESNPPLLNLAAAAGRHGVTFLSDDESASVGLGAGSQSWPVRELPEPEEVEWQEVFDVPVALVTGTNGKTTSVRLLSAIVQAAGKRPGFCSTEGVFVGSELVEAGDFAGPGGARRVLRDRRVEVAVLETARGGMLRRGLAVPRAEVAAITNVAEDHLGEWGIYDLDELAETKMVVSRAARRLVIHADDAVLAPKAKACGLPVTWFSLDPERPELAQADIACWLAGSELLLRRAGTTRTVADLADVPMTLGGAARHNVANALTAVGMAAALEIPLEAMRRGLASFISSAEQNPGRLNRFELGGVTVLVDFAHNPHGMAALVGTAAALPARRRLVLLGQAGDRDDAAIRALARAVWSGKPDRVIVKELTSDLRGRQAGEVPRLLAEELQRLGAPAESLSFAASELEAVREALLWAREGDLLLLVSHVARSEVLALLQTLAAEGWTPERPLPPP
ncbi:MAG: Mur ligase [Acidobacteria bacterium]|nr:Mur ligase [Acidobacteriota bacterium]